MCPVWFRHGVTSSEEMRDRSTHRHVSSNTGALKINNCKLDRCKMASRISMVGFHHHLHHWTDAFLFAVFLSAYLLHTHTSSIYWLKNLKWLEYRKVFFPRIPMDRIVSAVISKWWKNSTFNMDFMIRNWFVAHQPISFFSRCLFNGVSVMLMTRHKMRQRFIIEKSIDGVSS